MALLVRAARGKIRSGGRDRSSHTPHVEISRGTSDERLVVGWKGAAVGLRGSRREGGREKERARAREGGWEEGMIGSGMPKVKLSRANTRRRSLAVGARQRYWKDRCGS